jgi:hypothetical protein
LINLGYSLSKQNEYNIVATKWNVKHLH